MFLNERYCILSERHTYLELQGTLVYGIYCKLTDVCLLEPKSHEKDKERHEQHDVEKTFKVGDRVWLHLKKDILQGPCKKIKELWYGNFEVLEKVGHNSYRLFPTPFKNIYSVLNVENSKLYEPSMLD